MPGRYFLKTFGCQMNEYDSARMADILRASAGMVATDDPGQADLLLMNTCSVREKAEDKVYSLLGEWRQLKQQRPGVLIGVAGCVASQEGEAITARAPFVDLVFGPQTLHRLPDMIGSVRRTGRAVVDVSFPEIEKFDHLPEPRADGATAFVSIMEGCSKYCSFCVVPYTRGDEVSRPFASVIGEIEQLAAQGVAEVTLLGQNVNAYRGPMADGAEIDLATLIHAVAAIDAIERIRFTTSHPLEFDDSLIEAYASVPKLANHLHLPVQSGSDRVLAAMKRGYTVLEFKSVVRKLRAARPDLSLTSDFIVGFPGETEADFDELCRFIEAAQFDRVGVFRYSDDEISASYHLDGKVDRRDSYNRMRRLMALQRKISRGRNRALVGRRFPILVGGPSSETDLLWEGRLQSQAEEIDGKTFLTDFECGPAQPGDLGTVRITRASDYDLFGVLESVETR
ncbi:MAG: tRNA (N6-isopentenyl adenosine(37)-C2)-methylthiotransferase MiaB, partial [Steroidobacteraceae bacterium]|nr:tRNA (N6-isopentenyl adenosine(37)-C2)-methylthiotransferase MiaB [Steroidobacteraceae bacterium]